MTLDDALNEPYEPCEFNVTFTKGYPTHVTDKQFECALYYLESMQDDEAILELLSMCISSKASEFLRKGGKAYE